MVSPDGVAPSRIVCVNLPLHHKVQEFSSGTGSPRWSRKKGRKTVVVWLGSYIFSSQNNLFICFLAYVASNRSISETSNCTVQSQFVKKAT